MVIGRTIYATAGKGYWLTVTGKAGSLFILI